MNKTGFLSVVASLVVNLFLVADLTAQENMTTKILLELACNCEGGIVGACSVQIAVRNAAAAAVDVELSSNAFPFELELIDGGGVDVLAAKRVPSPTYRLPGPPTKRVRIAGNSSIQYSITVPEYISSRKLGLDIKQASILTIRAYAPIKVDKDERFNVVWSERVTSKGCDIN